MSDFGETAGAGGGCREFGADFSAELRTTEMRVKNDARWTANKCHAFPEYFCREYVNTCLSNLLSGHSCLDSGVV